MATEWEAEIPGFIARRTWGPTEETTQDGKTAAELFCSFLWVDGVLAGRSFEWLASRPIRVNVWHTTLLQVTVAYDVDFERNPVFAAQMFSITRP